MRRAGEAGGPRRVRIAGAAIGAVAILLLLVAVATGAVATGAGDAPESTPAGPESTPAGDLPVRPHESLPCTGAEDPTNFEVFSAGPAPAGVPLAASLRRCEAAAPSEEVSSNYVSYIYGECEYREAGDTGCAPPLEVQTWPACQRSLADYSFAGESMPHKKLPPQDSAEVVEFEFEEETRFEVYTKSSTIVVFAQDPALARKAIGLLRSQEKGKPPVTNPAALGRGVPEKLGPPSRGAMEGALPCES